MSQCILTLRKINGNGSKVKDCLLILTFSTLTYKIKRNIPCFAQELTSRHHFLLDQCFPIWSQRSWYPTRFFGTLVKFAVGASRCSAVWWWRSLSQYLMLAAAEVDVTGTNYQCQIIMVKKRLMLADKSWEKKQNPWHWILGIKYRGLGKAFLAEMNIRIKDEDKTIIDQIVRHSSTVSPELIVF